MPRPSLTQEERDAALAFVFVSRLYDGVEVVTPRRHWETGYLQALHHRDRVRSELRDRRLNRLPWQAWEPA